MERDPLQIKAEQIGDAALEFEAGAQRDDCISRACGTDDALRTLVVAYIRGSDTVHIDPLLTDTGAGRRKDRH